MTMSDTISDPVTREDAIKFLEGACRNWSKVPRLSEDDIGDVATELLRFTELRALRSSAGAVKADEIEGLIEELLDAQQDINLAANETMSQPLCDASALIDKTEALLRRILSALTPAYTPNAEQVTALEGPVKGDGFENGAGGFSYIYVGKRKFTADQVRAALSGAK